MGDGGAKGKGSMLGNRWWKMGLLLSGSIGYLWVWLVDCCGGGVAITSCWGLGTLRVGMRFTRLLCFCYVTVSLFYCYKKQKLGG